MLVSRRKLTLGASLLGAGTVLGAGLPMEQSGDDASDDADSDGRPSEMASEAQIAAVTGDGLIELTSLGPRSLLGDRQNLNGDTVSIGLPPGFELYSVSTFMLVESQEGTFGFQATSRGLALYSHAPEFGVDLKGMVSLGGGSLAHYKLTDNTNGDIYFTLWQGPHHDLFTTDYVSLDEAVGVLSGFKITDEPAGVRLEPRPGRFRDHKVIEMSATIEFGDFVVTLEKKDPSGVGGPDWPGAKGEGGEFYSVHGDQPGLLFVSDTALAKIESWRPDGRQTRLDNHLGDFLSHLRIDWQAA